MANKETPVELSEETKRLLEEGEKIRQELGGESDSQKKAPSKSSTAPAKSAATKTGAKSEGSQANAQDGVKNSSSEGNITENGK